MMLFLSRSRYVHKFLSQENKCVEIVCEDYATLHPQIVSHIWCLVNVRGRYMAGWLPAVKVILPYLAQIVTAAVPAFTKKADKTGSEDITRNQISELQDAVTHNAETLKILATQLQQVINGIDSGAGKVEKETKVTRMLALLAISLSIAAIILWFSSWLH
jgi:hypothetical protein